VTGWPRRCLPGDGMLAKECHSSSGLRLMGIDDPAKGGHSVVKEVSAACEDGRSTRIYTRRSRSHGRAMLMVTTGRSHTLGLAHSCEWSPGLSETNSWPLVEIQVGPHRIVSLMPAEVVDHSSSNLKPKPWHR
jgi:hypothetical protein